MRTVRCEGRAVSALGLAFRGVSVDGLRPFRSLQIRLFGLGFLEGSLRDSQLHQEVVELKREDESLKDHRSRPFVFCWLPHACCSEGSKGVVRIRKRVYSVYTRANRNMNMTAAAGGFCFFWTWLRIMESALSSLNSKPLTLLGHQ